MAPMTERARRSSSLNDGYYLDILCESDSGSWVLRLPPVLKAQQQELEQMLGKVFSGRPSSKENFALAQQLSLNWCFSKARQAGLALEDCWADA